MAFVLRPYQQDAVQAAYSYVKDSVSSAVITMATGAGKSLVIAELARLMFEHTTQRTLVLAPRAELVKQDAAKFKALGLDCSIYSASAGKKCLQHPVVFGSPGTVINAVDMLGEVCAVIVDEAQGITEQVQEIIRLLRAINRDLRVIGLTATPYRTGEGFIYKQGLTGEPVPQRCAYFDRLVYQIGTRDLINMGYLCDISTVPVAIEYDVSTLERDRLGRFTPASIERTFIGKGRRTSGIVADIVHRAKEYRATLIFTASRAHAAEVMDSLPEESFRYIDGNTSRKERAVILAKFKAGMIPYLVNVDVLTIGTDIPICDHIAIMRGTESDSLLQQIIGRGLRTRTGKTHCLLSDYAGNLEPFIDADRDIFDPEIKASKAKDQVHVNALCPKCGHVNQFYGRPNTEKLDVDANGNFIDLAGAVVMYEIYNGADKPPTSAPFAAHFGRRCQGFRRLGPKGRMVRCAHTWQDKKCHDCGGSNDIAARVCRHCDAELVDPNRYLLKAATEVARTPDGWQIGTPEKMQVMEQTSNFGNRIVRLTFNVAGRKTPIVKFLHPYSNTPMLFAQWTHFLLGAFGDDALTVQEVMLRKRRANLPRFVRWKKSKKTGYDESQLEW